MLAQNGSRVRACVTTPLACAIRWPGRSVACPRMMVKITNKASSAQAMGAVCRHLRYISCNGDRIAGTEAVRDLGRTWHLGGWGIPETSHRREVFDILLSMPPGTNRQAVRDAPRDFAAFEFGEWARLRVRSA
jgi:hypothetical protein